MDKLLILIEEGDSGKILSEENFYPRFNELLKYGLVEIKEDKIYLTAQGIEAKKNGVDFAIRKAIRQQYLDDQKREQVKQNWIRKIFGDPETRKRYITSLLLLILSLLPLFLKLSSRIKKKLKGKSSLK